MNVSEPISYNFGREAAGRWRFNRIGNKVGPNRLASHELFSLDSFRSAQLNSGLECDLFGQV